MPRSDIRLWLAALALSLSLGGCASLAPDARDARINAQVESALARYVELQAPNRVDAQTHNGVVYLRGLVSTPFEQALAGSVALKVRGVVRVENLVAVSNNR